MKETRAADSYCCNGQGGDDVVITGISGRFPGCDNVKELAEVLYVQRKLERSSTRFKREYFEPKPNIATLKDASKFDAEFFKIVKKGADAFDPQIRMLHEVVYEAILDSGYDPEILKGRDIGVYCGLSRTDAQDLNLSKPEQTTVIVEKNIRSYYANYISYTFDIIGPSFVLFAAESSALVALLNAFDDIKHGICEAAIVTSSQLELNTDFSKFMSEVGYLPVNGQKKAFETEGSNYFYGESVGALFIQKADSARRSYVTVVGIEQLSEGYFVDGCFISQPTLEELFNNTYEGYGVSPTDVDYVECDWTAPHVGFDTEAAAIANIFCKSRKDPLLIGSAKTAIGHCGAASGICSIIKAILIMETGIIPPTVVDDDRLSHCPALQNKVLMANLEPVSFNGSLIAVNSFGTGGVSVHVCLKRNQLVKSLAQTLNLKQLTFFSSRTKEGVVQCFDYIKGKSASAEFHSLLQKISTASKRNKFCSYAITDGQELSYSVKEVSKELPLVFLFSGIGCQWPGLVLDLMKIDAFSNSLKSSAKILSTVGIELLNIIKSEATSSMEQRNITSSLAVSSSIQIALVDLLKELGVAPDMYLGFGVGELLCAYQDGYLDHAQTLLHFYSIGKACEASSLQSVEMAVIDLPWDEAVKKCPSDVFPCYQKSKNTTVVTGTQTSLKQFLKIIKQEHTYPIEDYLLAGYPFHCPLVDTIIPRLMEDFRKIIKEEKSMSSCWIPTCYRRRDHYLPEAKTASAGYFAKNIQSPIYFHDALKSLPDNAVLLEIGQTHLFQSTVTDYSDKKFEYVSLMKKESDSVGYLLSSLGRLFTLGYNPLIEKLYPPASFPVPRGTTMISNFVKWDHSESYHVPYYSKPWVDIDMRNHHPSTFYLRHHRMQGQVVLPAVGYLVLAWQALADSMEKSVSEVPVLFENVTFFESAILEEKSCNRLIASLLYVHGQFEIHMEDKIVATGRIVRPENPLFPSPSPIEKEDGRSIISGKDIYYDLRTKGYEYGPMFQDILEIDEKGCKGLVRWKNNWVRFLDSMLMLPYISENERHHFVPTRIGILKVDPLALDSYIKENKIDAEKGLPVFNDVLRSVCHSAGVEIRNVHWQPVLIPPKTDTILFDAYIFVPYIEKTVTHFGSKLNSQQYMESCALEANRLSLLLENRTDESRAVSKADYSKIHGKHLEGNTILLHTIQYISRGIAEGCVEVGSEVFRAYLSAVEGDVLCRLDSTLLRSVLDIVEENIPRKVINSVEFCKGRFPLTYQLYDIVSNRTSSEWHLTVAHPIPNEISSDMLKNRDIAVQEYTDANPPNVDLVIGSFLHGSENELKDYVRKLAATIDQGFILLVYRSSLSTPETILQNACKAVIEVQSVELLEQLFQENSLCVIAERCSYFGIHLYLLKFSSKKKAFIHMINEESNTWLQDLMTAVESIKLKENSTLWVVSEGNKTSGILDIINDIRLQPAGQKVRCIFNCDYSPIKGFNENDVMYADILKKDCVFNVFKNGKWGSYRQLPIDEEAHKTESTSCSLAMLRPHDVLSLQWIASPRFISGRPFEASNQSDLYEVYYSGISFNDICIARGDFDEKPTGELKDRELMGHEYSGRNSSGCRIFGISQGSLSSSVLAVENLTWPIPDSWTMEEACTIPLAYTLAYYGLVIRGGLKPSYSVLIHCGAGGIGQAAISIAFSMNCDIFTTVGSEEKKNYLMRKFPLLKIEHIGPSRNSDFRSMVMRETKGRGVDVVLNSLSGDELKAGYKCVAIHGCIVDIGKIDAVQNKKIGLHNMLKNISLHGICLKNLIGGQRNIADVISVQRFIADGITNGTVKPIDSTVFHKDEICQAFKYVAAGKNRGKVLIKIRDEEPANITTSKHVTFITRNASFYNPEKCYIVISRDEGISFALVDWLAERGAKKFVFSPSAAEDSAYRRFCLNRLKGNGVSIVFFTLNPFQCNDAKQLLLKAEKIGPVGGIFSLITGDMPSDTLTNDGFDIIRSPSGTVEILDALSRSICKQLDWFVCFSSMIDRDSNAISVCDAYCNSAAERICEQRRADGLHGITIKWKNLDIGYSFFDAGENNNTLTLSPTYCFYALDQLLHVNKPVVCSYMGSSSTRNNYRSVFYDFYELLEDEVRKNRKPDIFEGTRPSTESGKERIIRLNEKTEGVPIMFIIPEGTVDRFRKLANKLSTPAYALQILEELQFSRIEDTAKDLLQVLLKQIDRKLFNYQYVNVAGHLFGTLVAFEMALQCENSLVSVPEVQTLFSVDGYYSWMNLIKPNGMNISKDKSAVEVEQLLGFLTPWLNEDKAKLKGRTMKLEDRTKRIAFLADELLNLYGRPVDREEIISALLLENQRQQMERKYCPAAKLTARAILIESDVKVKDSDLKEKLVDEVCDGNTTMYTVPEQEDYLLNENNYQSVADIIEKEIVH